MTTVTPGMPRGQVAAIDFDEVAECHGQSGRLSRKAAVVPENGLIDEALLVLDARDWYATISLGDITIYIPGNSPEKRAVWLMGFCSCVSRSRAVVVVRCGAQAPFFTYRVAM